MLRRDKGYHGGPLTYIEGVKLGLQDGTITKEVEPCVGKVTGLERK